VSDSPAIADALRWLTDLGSPQTFYWLCAPVVLVLLLVRRPVLAIHVGVTVWGAGVINVTLKDVVGRERPVWDEPIAIASGRSFPSGHAMLSTVVYGLVLALVWSRLPPRARPFAAASVIALVVLIGFTRVALGVHHLSDVLAGFAMGAAWLALCTWLRQRAEERWPVGSSSET